MLECSFAKFCKDYDNSWADSPDDLRYDADRVAKVGSWLDVDVSELCSELERKAFDWECELSDSQEDRDDYDEDERWESSRSPTDEADETFEGLLDELNESDS